MATAAEELFITPSGVSHQVRQLEDDLGAKLFNRTGRGLELTARGAELLPLLSTVFEQLEGIVDDFKSNRLAGTVNIAMPANFASRWFIPNLSKFEALHPDIDIRLSCQEGDTVRPVREVDCLIHFGHFDWPGYREYILFSENLILVCSPRLQRGGQKLKPSDIGKFRLLKVGSQPSEWDMWARGSGLQLPARTRTLTFETRELALQGAVEGLGFALAGLSDIGEDIRHGRLITAFESTKVVSGHYFLVVSEQRSNVPGVAALCEWLKSEFSDSSAGY